MRTLVVDDSKIAREITKTHLRRIEAVVVGEASNGHEAVELLANGLRVDAVFIDRYMPGMNGIAAVKAIRQLPDHADTLLLVVSSEGDSEKMREALEAGADEYLIKPFDTAALEAKLLQQTDSA